MNTMGTLVDRIKYGVRDPLLDSDDAHWQRATVRDELDARLAGMARHGLFGNVLVMQAVANQALYPMNAQATFLHMGRVVGGTPNDVMTITDTTVANFASYGIQAGDSVKNLTDNNVGIISTVGTTTLVCDAGFTGGVTNTANTLDRYLVQRPFTATTVVEIDAIFYDGNLLKPSSEDALERRLSGGWETRMSTPRYWTAQHTPDGTVVRVVPAPLVTGSSSVIVPPVPFPLSWQQNFLVYYREHPQQTLDDATTFAVPDAYEDALVYQAMSILSGEEGPYQELGIATAYRELAALWMAHLPGRR